MNEFPFQIKAAGATETARLRFANGGELMRDHRSFAPFAKQPSMIIREAVDAIQDLFVIEKQEMSAVIRRQERIGNLALVNRATSGVA